MVEIYILDTKQLDNEELFDNYYKGLSEFRRKKVDGFIFRKDKNLSLGAGILLDKKLQTLGLREKEADFVIGQFGKPSIKQLPELFFSISHSGHYVVVVFSDAEVGCDVEEINKAINEDKNYFVDWCIKESYFKAKGIGIAENLEKFDLNKAKNEYVFSIFDNLEGYSFVVCHKYSDKDLTQHWVNL